MSVEHTRYVWDLLTIDHSTKMVLLCYADHANTEGQSWPSTDLVARKCRLSERSVEGAKGRLVQLGYLVPMWVGGGRGRTNRYLVPVPETPQDVRGLPPETPQELRGMPTETPQGLQGFPEKPRSGRPETPQPLRPNHQEPEPPRARAREAVGPDGPDDGTLRAAGNPTPVADVLANARAWATPETVKFLERQLTTPPAGGAPPHDASESSSA